MKAVLLCLPIVSGCAKDLVVFEPVALPKVNTALMRDPGVSTCVLPKRDLYHPSEVGAYMDCISTERENVRKRLLGLQRAVRTREAATDKALKAKS